MPVAVRIIEESPSFARLLKMAGDRQPSHAYLLTGSSLPTLLRFARSFAAWLHCSAGGPLPCGVCQGCTLSRAGTHPAQHLVRAEGNEISIDAIRSVIEQVEYRTAGGLHRVFVIERAHALGEEAANAFLKTLEEPPPRTVFLLLTDRAEAVLPTVASRCATARVQTPPPEVLIEDYLRGSPVPAPWLYLALLITNSSLELLDGLEAAPPRVPALEGQGPGCSLLLPALEAFLARVPAEHLLRSAEPFNADAEYALAVFAWVLDWLTRLPERPGLEAPLIQALAFDRAGDAIKDVVTKRFKEAAKAFAEIYGKEKLDPSLDEQALGRGVRRAKTQHVLLLLACVQTAFRLALVARSGDGALPYGLERAVPGLAALATLPPPRFAGVARAVGECRRKLFANVRERLLLIELFHRLREVLGPRAAAAPVQPPLRPLFAEGGAPAHA